MVKFCLLTRIIVKFSDHIIILIFPIFLAFLNSNWIFSPVTNFLPDQWFYLGYFRYFYEYASEFPSNIHYFVERITWNVLGHFVYRLFRPLLANYVLHLFVCYMALFSLYGTLNILLNRRVAIITTLLMGGYPWFLRAVGWDYVDGIGIAHMLLLIYILTLTAHSQKLRFLPLLAGVVHASLVVTNLFWVGLAPGWIAYNILLNRPLSKEKWLKLLSQASCFLLGNLVLVIAIAIFYHSVTGRFFFLQYSFGFSAQQSHNENLASFISNLYGRMPPYWHILPAILSISLIQHMANSKKGLSHIFVAITALFVLTYACLIFWHYYGLPHLIIFSYSSFAIPAIFLLFGVILADPINSLSDNQFKISLGAIIFCLALPFLAIVITPLLRNLQGNLFMLVFLSFIIILLLSPGSKRRVMLPIIVSLSALFFLTESNSYVLLPDTQQGRSSFLAIIEASDAIDSYYPHHNYMEFRLWFRKDKNYNIFFSLSSLYLYPWGSSMDRPLSGREPNQVLTIQDNDDLHDGDKIVIISSNLNVDEVLAEANRALEERKASIVLKSIKEIRQHSMQFTLYFTEIVMTLDK